MIKTIFSLANSLAKRTRVSPTAIVEGRQEEALEASSEQSQNYQIRREAIKNAMKAKYANTEDPYIREKQQVVSDYADQEHPMTFEEAWHKLDEIEQRQSQEGWQRVRNANWH